MFFFIWEDFLFIALMLNCKHQTEFIITQKEFLFFFGINFVWLSEVSLQN